MKGRLKNVLRIINTILLIVCLVQMSNLKTEISNMRSNMGNQISNIQTNINNSYSYIEETLKKEASIVSNAEWEFGKMDIEARTVEVKAYVIPKEYQPDVTQVFFLCDDEELDAEYINGRYEVIMEVPLFKDVNIPSVLFKENETIRTENLDWVFNPRNELLPLVYAYNAGSVGFGKSKDKENKIYYEFLDFYEKTQINYLHFSKEGCYEKLQELIGKDPEKVWTEEERQDFSSIYYRFRKRIHRKR